MRARLIDILFELSHNNPNGPILKDQNGNNYKINSLVKNPATGGVHAIFPSFYYADVEFNPGARTIRATTLNSLPNTGKLLYTVIPGSWHP
jgi:hypothetical protein